MSDASQEQGSWQTDGDHDPDEAPLLPERHTLSPVPPAQRINELAIASFVLSLSWLAGVGSLLAIIFGLIARRQIIRAGGTQNGGGLAYAAVIIGVFGLIGFVAFVGLVAAIAPHRHGGYGP